MRPVLIGNEVGRALGARGTPKIWGGLEPDARLLTSHSLCPLLQPSLGVTHSSRALLYVILCPVGAYFPGDALNPVSLLADPTFIRAWVGGVGDCKLGG